MQSIWKSSQG
uniref:Uncharacterized protein n=1 Tax=Arundo donax TaxID=35708 RepID=A0A0A8ZB95_ARUDO